MSKKRVGAIGGALCLLLLSAMEPIHHPITASSLYFNKEIAVSNNVYQLVQQLDHEFQRNANLGVFPGMAVAILKDDEILLEKGYGVINQDSQEKVDKHTVFRLASTSKGVASALAGILVNESYFDWDDPIKKFIPNIEMAQPGHMDEVKVKHILSHSAGFPYHMYTNLVEANLSLNYIIDEMKAVEPIGEPGKIYSYQNAGYSLITNVIEKSTNQPLEQVIQEKLFDPLGMNDASVTYDDLVTRPNTAQPHVKVQGGWAKIKQRNKYYNAVPAGGVNASIHDMTGYLKGLLGFQSEVLPPHILDDLYKPQVNCPTRWKYFRGWQEIKDLDYGLGWRVADYEGRRLIYHGGYVKGFRSEIAFDPDEKIAICILTNSTSSMPKKSIKAFLKEYYALNTEALAP